MSIVFARPLDGNFNDDEHEVLQQIDISYAAEMGFEPQLSRSSLSFYSRTGHAFVATRAQEIRGFVLAQSVWNGTRPTVVITYLAVAEKDDKVARDALLEAVTKSAYDAAVYDLQAILPEKDTTVIEVLADKMYAPVNKKVFERKLGSRGAQQATRD